MTDERTRRPITVHRGETKKGFWVTVTTSDWRVIRAIERAVHSMGTPVVERGTPSPGSSDRDTEVGARDDAPSASN